MRTQDYPNWRANSLAQRPCRRLRPPHKRKRATRKPELRDRSSVFATRTVRAQSACRVVNIVQRDFCRFALIVNRNRRPDDITELLCTSLHKNSYVPVSEVLRNQPNKIELCILACFFVLQPVWPASFPIPKEAVRVCLVAITNFNSKFGHSFCKSRAGLDGEEVRPA